MQASRRAFVIGGLTLPLSLTLVGCTTRSLSPIKTTPTLQPTPLNLREARVGQSWKYLKINQFNFCKNSGLLLTKIIHFGLLKDYLYIS